MTQFLHPDEIRTLFSGAMSDMYRTEVPQYGTLIDLVNDVNEETLAKDPELKKRMEDSGELGRLGIERHGAIRVGTPEELFGIRRIFAVMGMFPVGYYDLSVAGIPVHSTAFRPIDPESLNNNPFRVFCSLLRLELVEDRELAAKAESVLANRKIFTDRALELAGVAEANGGLTEAEAKEFVSEALETFRWHNEATVCGNTYGRLHDAHRLIADVVSFKGPHINHLTPRTLDIDAVQEGMPKRGITPKAIVEGPSRRKAPIFLRQTSFKALEESVIFYGQTEADGGTHTARFGEIEQRGVALTAKGRAMYDDALNKTRANASVGPAGEGAAEYMGELAKQFASFPDDYDVLRREDIAFFQYRATTDKAVPQAASFEELLSAGHLVADPQTYEDFLPVSAAGIFQSNLGSDAQSNYSTAANQGAFETALGASVQDEVALYQKAQTESLEAALETLGQTHLLQVRDAA